MSDLIGKKVNSSRKVDAYRKAFEKYGNDPRSLQWVSRKSAEVRYKELVRDIDFEGKSILDVGCGFGDIVKHIASKTGDFSYTGIDIIPEFIEVAKSKYFNQKFMVGDYFGKPLRKRFDVVLSSGTLNANISNVTAYRKKAIETMFNQAREVVAFNMAGGHPQPRNESKRVYYADSLEILEYCFTLTSKVILRNQYRRKDFTIVLFK